MLKKLFKKIFFGNKYQSLVDQINLLENDLKILTDNELKNKSFKLQKQYASEQNLSVLISQAFAITREASIRTLGLRHYDVQLLGGLVLNDQKIAEMKTGEGKTLVATLPAFLNGLTKKGVHIVTVNDYLAKRDQIEMGQIYRFLGMETGLIQDSMSNSEKRKNYNADITYVTNSAVAFDYLRDNSNKELTAPVVRPFNYCIIDEVDSVLIDETQSPLIIAESEKGQIDSKPYIIADQIIRYLELDIHYQVEEKTKDVIITELGSKLIEQLLGIKNLYEALYNYQNPWIPYLINALKANACYFINVHYICQNNEIIMVDEFTGRVMPNRRWQNGLHQAMEAKERVSIGREIESVAEITYQSFFLLYPKLSGMTGTGKTAEIEFKKIYKLSVETIPAAKPSQRKDLPDLIYKDQFLKWTAIAQTCKKIASTGQPILIGTKSIDKSEMLAQLLSEYNLTYKILNAKPENVELESEIIAQAGKIGSITIATNMAGRGTDIILGGNINITIRKQLYNILTCFIDDGFSEDNIKTFRIKYSEGVSQKFISVLVPLINDSEFRQLSPVDIFQILEENDSIHFSVKGYHYSIKFLMDELGFYYKKQQKQNSKIVKNLGGLYVIGTERNDSKRVDNQLRGRCGRQGDPGTSRFFLSLDDDLLRLFGNPRIKNFLMNSSLLADGPLESRFITKNLDSSQAKIEEQAYQNRKNLFDYDRVVNEQTEKIYSIRRKILENSFCQTKIFKFINEYLKKTNEENFESRECFVKLENLLGYKFYFSYQENESLLIQLLKSSKIKVSILDEFSFYFDDKEADAEIVKISEKALRNLKKPRFDYMEYLKRQENLTVYEIMSAITFELDRISKDLELDRISEDLELDRISEENLPRLKNLERAIVVKNLDKLLILIRKKLKFLKEVVRWRNYNKSNPLVEYKKQCSKIYNENMKLLDYYIILDLIEFLRKDEN